MNRSDAITSDLPRPRKRRQWRRAPRKMERALTPLDRLLVLHGRSVSKLARVIRMKETTIYSWRNRHGGFIPPAALPDVAGALSDDGWILPEGFLTEPGVFALPERRESAA